MNTQVRSRAPWTPRDLTILRKMAGNNNSIEIAAVILRSPNAIKKQIRKMGLSLKLTGEKCAWSKYSDNDCELARQLHEDGMPIKTISEKIEIPYHALTSILYFKRA